MNSSITLPQQTVTVELLTVEQFAKRLQVSRTTVFEWLKTGSLEQGKHYFKIGRIIRFVWDAAVFLNGKKDKPLAREKVETIPIRPKGKRQLHSPAEPAVNLNY